MPGRSTPPGQGHRDRPHPSRGGGSTGRTVLASSSSGVVAPGYGSRSAGGTRLDDRPPPPGDAGLPPPPTRRDLRRANKPRRSRGERILRWSLAVVLVLVLIAAAGYAYVRYRWGQVKTLACANCQTVSDGQPFNVLLVGSDTRAGDTGKAAQNFGSASQVGGQRSDTIKILHVDPGSGTARLLSIPRDTLVQMPQQYFPKGGALSGYQKINTAFNNGPEPLIATIEDTFGISIAHFVEVDFQGLTNAVDAVGGVYLDFPYPVRDNDNGNNNSGLNVPHTGCQKLDGSMTLALARSRYYQYYANGYWHYDPSSDIGRIERQNIVIQAIASRARGNYNPLTLNAFLGSVVHDVTVDQGMSFGTMFSLATTYHAFSPSSLASFTLPTVPEVAGYAGDVEVVNQPQAQQVLTQFLGTAPGPVTTPPVDKNFDPIYPPSTTTTTTTAPSTPTTKPAAPSPSASAPSFDPTVCSP